MPNPWFRLYSEFSHDPKVQMMPEAMQRRLVMLFCLQCNETLETLHETELAFQLRISDEELAQTKTLFIAKGFIDHDWTLLNWSRRQYVSDSSTERVRRHRQHKKQDETLQKQVGTECGTNRNALDTDTEAETDPEAEEKKTCRAAARVPTDTELQRVYDAYPRKLGPMKAKAAIRKAVEYLGRGEGTSPLPVAEALDFLTGKAKRFAGSPAGQAGEFTPHPTTWFNQGRYLDDESEWQGVRREERGHGTTQQRGSREAAEQRQRRIDEETRSSFARLSARMGFDAAAENGVGEARA